MGFKLTVLAGREKLTVMNFGIAVPVKGSSGEFAVDKAIEFANDACSAEECAVPASGLVFQWGRQVRRRRGVITPQDCTTAPYTEDDEGLPAATLDHDGVMEFFQTEFGFDANETVALLGAHSSVVAATSLPTHLAGNRGTSLSKEYVFTHTWSV